MKKSLTSLRGFFQVLLVLGIGALTTGAHFFITPLPKPPASLPSIPEISMRVEPVKTSRTDTSTSELSKWLETSYHAHRLIAISS